MSLYFISVSQNLRNDFAETGNSREPTLKKHCWMGPRAGLADGLGNKKISRINQDYNHGVMYFRCFILSSSTLCATKAPPVVSLLFRFSKFVIFKRMWFSISEPFQIAHRNACNTPH